MAGVAGSQGGVSCCSVVTPPPPPWWHAAAWALCCRAPVPRMALFAVSDGDVCGP